MENKKDFYKKGLIFTIIFLIIGASFTPSLSKEIERKEIKYFNENIIDINFIKNLTENLSNIIFTEYNESAGELAKGRAFGTKGEWKGAKILAENMTKLGLYVINETIINIEEQKNIASKLEVMSKGLTIHKKNSVSKKISNCNFYIHPRYNLTGALILGFAKNFIKIIFPNFSINDNYNFYNPDKLTYNCSEKNIEIKTIPKYYSLFIDMIRNKMYNSPFVFLCEESACNPNPPIPPNFILTYKFILNIFERMFKDFKIEYPPNSLLIQSIIWDIIYSNCKGVIVYDFNNETYNIKSLFYNTLPVISINGSLGRKIKENLKDYKIDFYINQRWNNSVKSYNVIGQLNGTNPDETVIVGGLYDSWWCQGTADGAIGMSIAIGIAKYFYDNNIKPKCNVKFVAFGGEEAGGFRGATFHEFANRKENITTVIDINQVGFTQINPRITLTIITNNESLNNTLNKITSETDYERRIGNVTDFKTEFNKNGGPSNTNPFAISSKRSCNTILFVKDGGWTLHHRDGEKHTKGDVMEYFNWTDTSITSEMIWNVTKYFTVNPDSYFINCTFEEIDSVDNNNDLPNSINAKFYIKTSIPNDHITLNASLIKKKTGKNIVNEKINYSINSKGFKNIVTLKLPKHEKEGWYSCKLSLYNSTGRINDLLKIKENNFNETYSSPYFYLYPK